MSRRTAKSPSSEPHQLSSPPSHLHHSSRHIERKPKSMGVWKVINGRTNLEHNAPLDAEARLIRNLERRIDAETSKDSTKTKTELVMEYRKTSYLNPFLPACAANPLTPFAHNQWETWRPLDRTDFSRPPTASGFRCFCSAPKVPPSNIANQ